MRRLIKIAAFTVAALLPFPTIAANTSSTDYSDLWWNASESGWGANLSHQGDVIFATLFVYAESNKARWYIASDVRAQVGSGDPTYVGLLYEASGPYIGAYFNPDNVTLRQVGSIRLIFPAGQYAQLHYDVDGVTQTKWIERLTFRANNLAGTYHGAMVGTLNGCASGSGAFVNSLQFIVDHAATEIAVTTSAGTVSACRYAGAYTQYGRMGAIQGNVTCNNGRAGSFAATEIEAGQVGFTGRYVVDYGNGCTETGRIGAAR